MMREVIKVGDTSFNLMTASVDATTWRLMYHRGIREANYPVPAICFHARYDNLINALIEHREREWGID